MTRVDSREKEELKERKKHYGRKESRRVLVRYRRGKGRENVEWTKRKEKVKAMQIIHKNEKKDVKKECERESGG